MSSHLSENMSSSLAVLFNSGRYLSTEASKSMSLLTRAASTVISLEALAIRKTVFSSTLPVPSPLLGGVKW